MTEALSEKSCNPLLSKKGDHMVGRVVSLLVVLLASMAFAEDMPSGNTFYLGIPHDKTSSQVKVADKLEK